jgi:alkylhydroperoxidase family enzyme
MDDVEEIRKSDDDDYVATRNAAAATKTSFGGANRDNASAVGFLSQWFNFTAGNPEQAAGISSNADSATAASILASGANASFQEMTNIVHDKMGKILRVLWYYRYVDPFAAPDVRKAMGRAHDMSIKVKARSMVHVDPVSRSRAVQVFANQTMPAAFAVAAQAFQMQQPFNLPEYLRQIADLQDITDSVQEWFQDPTFADRTQLSIQKALAEQAFKSEPGSGISAAGAVQNDGNASIPAAPPTAEAQFRADAQDGANPGQSALQGTGV